MRTNAESSPGSQQATMVRVFNVIRVLVMTSESAPGWIYASVVHALERFALSYLSFCQAEIIIGEIIDPRCAVYCL